MIKSTVRRLLRNVGVDVVRTGALVSLDADLSPYQPHTLVSPDRQHVLVSALRMTASVPGDIAECGVYRGGTAMLLRDHREDGKHLFLLDTFEGMPDLISDRDLHRAGDFSDTSLTAVHGLVGDRGTTYLPGLFSERFPEITERAFSFVHVDADLYQSVAECIEFFVPRLSPGAVMVFDDYGFKSCPGAKQAVDERLAVVWLPTGQAVYFHR